MQFLESLFNGKSKSQAPPIAPAAKATPSNGCTSGGDTRADKKVEFGFSLMRGKRQSMEDFYHAKFDKDQHGNVVGLFGIFDGHGGPNAASFVEKTLFESLKQNRKFTNNDVLGALADAFETTDGKYLDQNTNTSKDDGCTAVTAVLIGQKLYVANVGDSRAILCRGGEAYPLSVDHKPNSDEERKRIEQLGGVVVWAGTWRVGGVLAVSRAFGDRLLKKYVIPEPYTQEEHLSSNDELIIMASDGLWDVIKNQEAVTLVRDIKDAEKAAKRLTEEAYSRGSNDNISCIVVRFNF